MASTETGTEFCEQLFGQTATVRFEVRVEFHWPTNPARGWRSVILNGPR